MDVIVPDFYFVVENALDLLSKLATYETNAVKRRMRSGQGTYGPLPVPKDGGAPMMRSGQLYNSIGAVTHANGRNLPFITIEPMGNRSDASDRRRARGARLRQARAPARAALKRQGFGKEEIKHLLKGKKLGRIRGGRNMDVAAILANKPKDKRAANGRRDIYTIFVSTREERYGMTGIVQEHIEAALLTSDGERYSGKGT